MQVTLTIGDGPIPLIISDGGGQDRPSRVVITVVGDGTLYVDRDPAVSDTTGVPITEGVYISDEHLFNGEVIYAYTDSEVDIRILPQGAKVDIWEA